MHRHNRDSQREDHPMNNLEESYHRQFWQREMYNDTYGYNRLPREEVNLYRPETPPPSYEDVVTMDTMTPTIPEHDRH